MSLILALLLLACGDPAPRCAAPQEPLAEAQGAVLTCAEAAPAHAYATALAGRPVPIGRVRAHVRSAFVADPKGTVAELGLSRARADALRSLAGFEAAERRSTFVWDELYGEGVFPGDRGLLSDVVAPWTRVDADRLALTEVDVEGWILYGSLAREVQDGGVLRISVADRVQIYRTVTERYHAGSREDRVALAALGAFWPELRERWQGASYELQQAWIRAAPLPPPMTATSLGYLGSILEGDPVAHARAVHEVLGPLQVQIPEGAHE